MKVLIGWKQMAVVVLAVIAGLFTVAAQTNQATPEPFAEEPPTVDGTNGPAISNAPATNAPPAKAVRPAQLQLPDELKELVRRAEAGTNEEALIEFVRYPATRYPITVDQILYLRDLGISNRVLEALVQYHPLQTGSTNETAVAEEETPSGMDTNAANVAPQVDTSTPGMAPQTETNLTDVVPDTAVDENVFYSSLAPYGTWLDLPGYGWAWQPTVVTINPYWQPYFNDGSWIWSDCGWYWQSYYSWGWAPFHYGRWWRYPRYGWLWRPDRVWGPAWVTWRQSPQFCGWAPLPPGARFHQGIGWTDFGRPVGFHHNFGLPASAFTFVPLNHFTDRFLTTHRLRSQELQTAFNRTTVNNNVVVANQHIVNQGIDPQRVAAATHRPIQPIPVRNLQRSPTALRTAGSDPAASLQTAPNRVTAITPSGQLPPTGLSFGPNRRFADPSQPQMGFRVPTQIPPLNGQPTTPSANPGAGTGRSLPQANLAVPQAQPNVTRPVPQSGVAVPPTAPALRPPGSAFQAPAVGRPPVLPPSPTFQPPPANRTFTPPPVTAPVGPPPTLAPSPAFRTPTFQPPPSMPSGGAGGGHR